MENFLLYSSVSLLLILLGIAGYLFFRLRMVRKLAITDEHSGIMNYRGLQSCFKKIVRKYPVSSMALIDIDNFRSFNEESYALGDAVLKEFSVFINGVLPKNSVFARFRIGDEFIIIFKNTTFSNAEKRLEEIKQQCRNHSFECLNAFPDHRISFTEGMVELNTGQNDIEKYLLTTEINLKKNKLTGTTREKFISG
ncbi:MAG TPA: GGDEF domain-containing protein [Bacteroidales bacterium]|nr:GGDEF domain-containing protein [Bacteroidales bacterium]